MNCIAALILSVFLIGNASAANDQATDGQQSEMARLLDERADLYESYREFEKKRSSFWGTQSKKDLRRLIGTLQSIIEKDNELIMAVRQAYNQDKRAVISESRNSSIQASQYENTANALKNRLMKTQQDLRKLEAEEQEFRSRRVNRDIIITVQALAIAGLLWFAFFRKRS